ncbi:extra spindle pole bodies like 1, separase [Augochlora pura]
MEEIFEILRDCRLGTGRNEEASKINENESLENMKSNIEKLLSNAVCCMGTVEYSNLNKMLAIFNLKIGNELEAINRLIESHAVLLRQQTIHRYVKSEFRKTIQNNQQVYGLNSSHVNFNRNNVNFIDNWKSKLLDLPKEWYLIQVTAPYHPIDIAVQENKMQEIYISILPTGTKDIEPLCITIPKPKLDSYDICYEIQKLLVHNMSDLQATYANNKLYWEMRDQQNNRMKTAIQALEFKWLREWRILFVADPIDEHNVTESIVQMIDKLILDDKNHKNISERAKWLLKKVALTACFLTREEIARAVKYVLTGNDKLANNIILSIYGKLKIVEEIKNVDRKTLVLIIDEHMDYIPFESMEIVSCQPITRFPSLHILYALFKEHESTIENGCKIIKIKNDMGTCIVNPANDLPKMEKRLRLFIEYWLPNWKSLYNVEPEVEVFEDALVNHDILMYSGHGNGIQYLPREQIERLRVKAVVLLFGCSSVKLLPIGGRYPPYGVSNQYLIASSPCVLGMLWEVTDADTDKMTANFISSWIPSLTNNSWADVDINLWCQGIFQVGKNSRSSTTNLSPEPEMLRAVAKSKNVCSQYMTAAAIVVRGLPIKLI